MCDDHTVPERVRITLAVLVILGSGVFMIWWLALPHYPWMLLGPGARFFTFTSAWHAVYLPVSACFAAVLLIHTATVLRPRWTGLARWRGVLANAGSVVGTALLLGAGDLLTQIDATQPMDPRTMQIVGTAVRWSLVWTMIVAAFQMLREAMKALRKAPPSS